MIILQIIFSIFKEIILCFKPNLQKMFVIICGIIILSWFMVVCMLFVVFLGFILNKNSPESVQFLAMIFSIVFFIAGLFPIVIGIDKTKEKFKIFNK